MDAEEYNELRSYGESRWKAYKVFAGDGWEDCVQDAIVEIYEFGLPKTDWKRVVAKHIEKERARVRRRQEDTVSLEGNFNG